MWVKDVKGYLAELFDLSTMDMLGNGNERRAKKEDGATPVSKRWPYIYYKLKKPI